MPKPSLTITIEVVGGDERVTIKDSAGNEKVVTGFAMFGSDHASGDHYVFSWGKVKEAAHAVTRGLTAACNRGDEWYIQFYRNLLGQMIQATGIEPAGGKRLIGADELLERWEEPNDRKTRH